MANHGKKRSKQVRENISRAKLGKKFSEEHKANLSTAKKGMLWWNNGVICVMARECPDGFTRGRIYRRKDNA